MEGLAQIAGEWYREITVGGRAYRLAPPRLRDLAALEAEILARLPDPLEQAARAAASIPAAQAPAFWQAAFAAARRARSLAIRDLDDLPEVLKAAASAYLLLHRHHADEIQTLEDAVNWCELVAAEHGERLRAILESVREPELSAPGGAEKKHPAKASLGGESSSASAPSGSAGRRP